MIGKTIKTVEEEHEACTIYFTDGTIYDISSGYSGLHYKLTKYILYKDLIDGVIYRIVSSERNQWNNSIIVKCKEFKKGVDYFNQGAVSLKTLNSLKIDESKTFCVKILKSCTFKVHNYGE